jgi:hypothetical protein
VGRHDRFHDSHAQTQSLSFTLSLAYPLVWLEYKGLVFGGNTNPFIFDGYQQIAVSSSNSQQDMAAFWAKLAKTKE